MNSCSICNRQFEKSDLLESSQQEYFCKQCFKQRYCAGRQLSTKKTLPLNKCEGDSLSKPRKMFSLEELSMIKQGRDRKYGFYTSKRPLQCPHVDCNRYVSVFDLIAHFQHEHMEVPIIETGLDERNPLAFYPRDVRYGNKQCLILLNVVPTKEETNNGSYPEKLQTPVTMTVLASRLSPLQLGEDTNDMALLEDDGPHDGSVLTNNDKIIIWTSSNVVSNYSYTVAVSTVAEDIRVKYYGPILQLGNSPERLCMEGHCLILSHYHFLGMSENSIKPLQLDVIVHSED